MKNSILLLAVLGGGIAGAASALLTTTALSGDEGDVRLAAAPGGGASNGEIADLRAKNAKLEERLRLLESQLSLQSNQRVAAVEPARADFDLSELEQLLASLTKPDNPPPAGLQRLVERVLDDKEAREQAEREERDRLQREERLDQRMADMSEKLGLDQTQQKQMRQAIWERDEARNALFGQMRGGGGPGGGFGGADRQQIMEAMGSITAKANTVIQGALSPAQYEAYMEEYGNDRGGFGGGRGGGRGGRGN